MECELCDEQEPQAGRDLCENCKRLRASFQRMTPERQARFKDAMFAMADDLLDERFGPEAGTVIN